MKYQAVLAGKIVGADSPFIVFSHTKSIVAACSCFAAAKRELDLETARCAEWGKESDAVILEWRSGAWAMCGSLYDTQRSGEILRRVAA